MSFGEAMTFNRKTLALALVFFGATTVAARADDLAAQFGGQAGECFRSGWNSVSCTPAAPRYFNQAGSDRARHIRSRQRD
jgi:hypothetical protein